MEVEDRQPRTIKPAKQTLFRLPINKAALIIIGTLTFIVIIIIVLIILKPKIKNSLLSNKINNVTTSWHSCSDGMKQLGSVVSPKLAKDTSYSRSVREKVLAYAVNCEFYEGNSKQALAYADQLGDLYKQDGNAGLKKYNLLQYTVEFIERASKS